MATTLISPGMMAREKVEEWGGATVLSLIQAGERVEVILTGPDLDYLRQLLAKLDAPHS